MEKKPPTREEANAALSRLEELSIRAEDDPTGYGRKHRQQIINTATEFVNGDYDFPPDSNDRDVVEAHLADLRDIKLRAKDIRARALSLPL